MNNSFRGHFREFARRSFEGLTLISDLNSIHPREERRRLRERLLDEEVWGANEEAQLIHRYRFVVMSNFITNPEKLELFELSLSRILSDLQPGSVVLLIGGSGGHYPKLQEAFDRLVFESGLRLRVAETKVRSRAADTEVIVTAARTVADHVVRLHPILKMSLYWFSPHSTVENRGAAEAQSVPTEEVLVAIPARETPRISEGGNVRRRSKCLIRRPESHLIMCR